jgi:Mg2+/Co2+ transporter CorB
MMDLISQDKKVKRGQLTFILVRGIGQPSSPAMSGQTRSAPSSPAQPAIMTLEDWFAVAAIVLCLLASFFFAGSETALTASSRATMLRLQQDGNRNAGIVNRLLAARERLIGALLLGNNAVNILASSLATSVFLVWFGDVGVIYATGLMTVLVVVFAEVLPKTIAFNAPDRMALAAARPMALVVRVLSPVLVAIEWLVRQLLRLLGVRIGEEQSILAPHEEIRGTVDLLHREGSVEKLDRDMMGGLLDLRDLTVADVMVHRTEMTTVNADDAAEDIVNAVLKSGFTRIPLWRDKPENIVGILHARICSASSRTPRAPRPRSTSWRSPCRRGSCPTSVRCPSSSGSVPPPQTHFALVVDEYGEVEGWSRSRTSWRRSSAIFPMSMTCRCLRAAAAGRLGQRRRVGADPRSQSCDGLEPAGRRGRPPSRDLVIPRGALDPRRRPELHLPWLPLQRDAQAARTASWRCASPWFGSRH